MHVAIRVDASPEIGIGHFMRCLTLADMLFKHGNSVLFISRDISPIFKNLVESKSHKIRNLPKIVPDLAGEVVSNLKHASWLKASWLDDAEQTQSILKEVHPKWLIVDHYAIDVKWEIRIKPYVKYLLVIDDLADRFHHCDVLLDQNLLPDFERRYTKFVNKSCQLWLGPRFALLKENFSTLCSQIQAKSITPCRGLIAFAGADTGNNTLAAIQVITTCLNQFDIEIHVLISSQHPSPTDIICACEKYGFNLHIQIQDVASLLASVDIAVAACGFMCYELIAMRVPAILIPVSSIQFEVASALAELNAAIVLPFQGNRFPASQLKSTWIKLLSDHAQLRSMSESCTLVTDGLGSLRVVQNMMEM